MDQSAIPGQAYLSVVSPGSGEDSLKVGDVLNANKDGFQIEDFTATSDWEKFEARLQEILRAWKNAPSPKSSSPGGWTQVHWKQKKNKINSSFIIPII